MHGSASVWGIPQPPGSTQPFFCRMNCGLEFRVEGLGAATRTHDNDWLPQDCMT